MTTQNYLIVESNIVTNNVVWDGNTETWQPPVGSIQLVDATTPALVWQFNDANDDWVLVEVVGAGGIGFTWNPTTEVLTTNEPKPKPMTQGTQTL